MYRLYNRSTQNRFFLVFEAGDGTQVLTNAKHMLWH